MKTTKRTRPLLIEAAVNGAEYSPREFPAIPVTAEEAVNDAVKVYAEGARFAHFHAREARSGNQFADLEWFRSVRQGIAEEVHGLAVSFASSRKGLVARQIQNSIEAAQLTTPQLSTDSLVEKELVRAIGMAANPQAMTIFNALDTKMNSLVEEDSQAAFGTYQGAATRGYTDPILISAFYQKLKGMYESRGIVPEYEITTMGALWTMEMLARRGWIPEQSHFLFLFGFSARLPITRAVFDLSMAFVRYLRHQYGIRPVVTAGAVIQPRVAAVSPRGMNDPLREGTHDYLELLEWVLEDDTVDGIRVGLEDTPFHFGRNACNAELVALISSQCENSGVSILRDSARVQEMFGIRRYVAFHFEVWNQLVQSGVIEWASLSCHRYRLGQKISSATRMGLSRLAGSAPSNT